MHVPNAANGIVKVRTLQAIRAGIAAAEPGARVVCGDLNTPRRELPSGEVISFARDRNGRLRRERGPEWDSAELAVVPGLEELGYRDAYRAVHGYGRSEPSWTWKRIAGHNGGWRIDHIFASSQLRPIACCYHHAWRDDGLSDHSALEADFSWPPLADVTAKLSRCQFGRDPVALRASVGAPQQTIAPPREHGVIGPPAHGSQASYSS